MSALKRNNVQVGGSSTRPMLTIAAVGVGLARPSQSARLPREAQSIQADKLVGWVGIIL